MTEETAVPMDKLARVYRKIRGKMQEMTKAHDEALAQLQVRQALLLQHMDQQLRVGVAAPPEGLQFLAVHE